MNIKKYLTETTPRMREFRRNIRWNAQTFTRTVALVMLMLMMAVSLTGVAALEQANDDPISLPDYIMQCYDGKGFADYPGGMSTLDSTLDAVNLLMDDTDRKDWSLSLVKAQDHIMNRYSAMQSMHRGGFVFENNTGPDFRTSALALETLKALGRLDVIDVKMVERYLWSSFRGSLSLDRWITEGDFETKYWALRVAYAIDRVEVLGLKKVDLDYVLAPHANRSDFLESHPYLVWGQEFFATSERFGGGFNAESYERKLEVVHSLSMMLRDKTTGPTLMPLLIDADTLAEEVVSRYDEDKAMFRSSDGSVSLCATAAALDVLEITGRVKDLFAGPNAPIKLADSVKEMWGRTDAWQGECSVNTASIHDRRALHQIDLVLDRAVNEDVVVFRPTFDTTRQAEIWEDSLTGIKDWEVDHTRVTTVPDILWELVPEAPEAAEAPVFLLPYGVIMLLGLVASLCRNREMVLFLSALCIVMFLVQQGYGVETAASFIADAATSLVPPRTRAPPDMTSIGTAWVDTSPKGPAIDQVSPISDFTLGNLDTSLEEGRPGQFPITCRTRNPRGIVDSVCLEYAWTGGSDASETMDCYKEDSVYKYWKIWLDVEWGNDGTNSRSLNYTISASGVGSPAATSDS